MFLFFHSEQKDTNISYYKGTLFEYLLKQYLDASGYEVEVRRKHNSLEYDIEGEDRATNLRLIGEAKAHTASISGQDFSAFVGKLLPLGLTEKKLIGLFLATAALTPDADNYYRSISSFGVVARTGKDLLNNVRQALRLPEFEPLARQLRGKNYRPQHHHILSTDHGVFVAVTAGSVSSAAPAYFAIFQPDGQLLSDRKYLLSLADNVPELKALKPILGLGVGPSTTERIISKGLVVGADWTDYRNPAPPQLFVGRRELIQRLHSHIKTHQSPNFLQIKSRSGVGKSSILAFLEHELSEQGLTTELHDARDVRSILDLYSLIQRFTNSVSTPQDFRDVEEQLKFLVSALGQSHAVFMIDQFESTFTNKEIFQAYESLASLFLKFAPSLFICIARKNDQITTYDDSKVSLEKLNTISKPYELKDFDQTEAAELIERTNSSAIKPVGRDVLAYVLEFAQGFPWLVKRTMAHIIRLSASGVSQGELFAAGLRLDDLFDEELEGLDEIERDYLTRIAARLPADYHQLQIQFEEDPLLPKILDKLTQSRLLRLTGSTYDTYNDVFKEYLLYRRLPEYRQAIVYRIPPGGTLKVFHWAVDRPLFSVEELEWKFNFSRGSAFNHLRELGAHNLIRRDGNNWRIPQTVIDVYRQGRLGEYLRRQLAENNLVANLINRVAQSEIIKPEGLPAYLKSQFPFVEASDKTWISYAGSFLSWLAVTRLVELTSSGQLSLPTEDRLTIIEGLGNLSVIRARTGLKRAIRGEAPVLFVPGLGWEKTKTVVAEILNNQWPQDRESLKAVIDLRKGGWLRGKDLLFTSSEEFERQVRELLESPPYDELWVSLKAKQPVLPVFMKIVNMQQYSEKTYKWKLYKIISWGKGVGLVPQKRQYKKLV